MELLLKYFPELTERQREQFAALLPLYEDWNSKINVISRKDMANFYEHHVLHSLAIAKVQPFKTQADILDVGTGGGFPGIPLAIMFPHSNFYLIDSIGKKVKVVQNVVASLGLKNVRTEQIRAEQVQGEFDFIVLPHVKLRREYEHAVVARVGAFLEELRHTEENVLISTHAIAMKGILEYLTPDSNGAYWSKFIGNCAVYTTQNQNGQFTIPTELC